jgi:hypothetical protein
MAITSIKTGSSFTNLKKYNDFLAGNEAYIPNNFESIATVTVGAGGTSAVTFNSIPSTYQHLQVRAFGKDASIYGAIFMSFNNDTYSTNFSRHGVYGDGASAAAFGAANAPYMNILTTPASSGGFGGAVIDVLDYANTNKFKTIRSLTGWDNNGSGIVGLFSGSWRSTTAVSRIDIISDSTIGQYSSFALYGIKE